MTTTAERHPAEPAHPATAERPDWATLIPADPEIMTAAEGDTAGLAQLQERARARYTRRG